MADYAWAPLMAILAEFHESLLPAGTVEAISTFTGERTFEAQAYYPPYDYVPRNITTWLSENLTIGAESYNENVVGGPSTSQQSFNPAVIQWTAGNQIAFVSVSSSLLNEGPFWLTQNAAVPNGESPQCGCQPQQIGSQLSQRDGLVDLLTCGGHV